MFADFPQVDQEAAEGIESGRKVFTQAAKDKVERYLEQRGKLKEGEIEWESGNPSKMLPSVNEDEYSMVSLFTFSSFPR